MPGENLPSAQTPADFRSQGALKTFVFAMDLIAAKPVKPCDRAVFRAFYLLLKKERKMPSDGVWKGLLAAGGASRALVWRRMGLLRLKRAHRLGALLGRIAWALQADASFGKPTGPNRQAPNRPSRRNQAPPRPAFAAAHTSQAFADFATGLIAAKPEKPCDGAVFGAFYLLLKRERNTPAGRL